MNSIKYLLAMLLSIAVVACGGGGGGGGGPTVPGTPTTVTASPRIASAIVSFIAPVNNGGAAITGYTVTSSPGGFTASGAASPITVTGLTNNLAYTFTVVATNSVGNSAASTLSNSVMPAATATIPGAPTGATATAGNTQATVTFAAPASDGGAAITGYTVTSNPAGGVDSNAGTTGLTHTITGLSNGTPYTFTVVATNSVGNSATSSASNSVTPTVATTVPGAPNIGTATASNASATVTFTAPASNGGATITGYTVTSSPGGFTASGAASPLTVIGLTNGTAYTFTVVATNSVGNSPASSASNPVTPVTVPAAPTAVTGTAGNAQVTVSFTAPANTGGAAITGYTVTSSPGGITAAGTASPITVTGLTNNLAYTFTVVATNSAGNSAASSSSSAVTPVTGYTVPGVPTSVAATAGNAQATVTFAAPASNGGTAITGYTVTSHPAGGTDSNAGTTGLTHTVTGLSNGVAYTFTVVATNSVGNSPASSASNSVTPALAPVSGAVTGAWVTGVTINVTGTNSTQTTTDSNGAYSLNLAPGNYILTPSLPGYNFTQPSVNVTVPANSSTPITGNNFVSTSAVASSSVSGTLSYAGTKTGGITLRVLNSGCIAINNCQIVAAVHLANQGGAFTNVPYTIRGITQTGNFVVKGGIGVVNSGYPNASNPGGSAAFTVATIGTNVTGANITVTDPATPAPVTPTGVTASPGNSSAFILYTPPVNAGGSEIATSYKIYWGTDAAASTGGGNATFGAQGLNQTVYFLNGLTNTTALYFKMTALVGTTESAASGVFGPVTIGAPTGANTVSGTVTFPGTATGPMMVGAFSNNAVYYTTIANPVSPQSYSITGVTTGSYQSFAVIDMNNNGVIDIGDLSNTGVNTPTISVSGATTSNLTLSSANATVIANTDHQLNGANHYYSIILGVNDGTKRAVGATVISGPNIAVPYDMGSNFGNNNWIFLNTVIPATGDTYTYRVTYSDGTTQDLTASVTAVLPNGALPQSLATVTSGVSCGGCSVTVPLFTWAAPASIAASSTYRLQLNGNNDSTNWYYPQNNGLPSTTTPLQVLYNADGNASGPLTSGNGWTYNWQIQVRDSNGNSATTTATYTLP